MFCCFYGFCAAHSSNETGNGKRHRNHFKWLSFISFYIEFNWLISLYSFSLANSSSFSLTGSVHRSVAFCSSLWLIIRSQSHNKAFKFTTKCSSCCATILCHFSFNSHLFSARLIESRFTKWRSASLDNKLENKTRNELVHFRVNKKRANNIRTHHADVDDMHNAKTVVYCTTL